MHISKKQYSIRPITIEDNARLSEIILSVMSSFGCIGAGFSSSDPEIRNLYEAYKGDRTTFYAVVDEQQDVVWGCGGIGPLEGAAQDICELRKMYFLSELRGNPLERWVIQNATSKP